LESPLAHIDALRLISSHRRNKLSDNAYGQTTNIDPHQQTGSGYHGVALKLTPIVVLASCVAIQLIGPLLEAVE